MITTVSKRDVPICEETKSSLTAILVKAPIPLPRPMPLPFQLTHRSQVTSLPFVSLVAALVAKCIFSPRGSANYHCTQPVNEGRRRNQEHLWSMQPILRNYTTHIWSRNIIGFLSSLHRGQEVTPSLCCPANPQLPQKAAIPCR